MIWSIHNYSQNLLANTKSIGQCLKCWLLPFYCTKLLVLINILWHKPKLWISYLNFWSGSSLIIQRPAQRTDISFHWLIKIVLNFFSNCYCVVLRFSKWFKWENVGEKCKKAHPLFIIMEWRFFFMETTQKDRYTTSILWIASPWSCVKDHWDLDLRAKKKCIFLNWTCARCVHTTCFFFAGFQFHRSDLISGPLNRCNAHTHQRDFHVDETLWIQKERQPTGN